MPRAATVLANSAVYYKGNKEPWDWLVRQFIYILRSIFIYFKMINSAEAPPLPAECCSQPRAAAPGAAAAGRGRLWSAGGCRGSSARDLGSLPEMQRVGDLCAAVVSPLQEGQDGEKLILAPAPRHDPPASSAGIRYSLLASRTFILTHHVRTLWVWGLFFFKHLHQEQSMSGPYKVPDRLEQEVTGCGRAVQRRLRTRRERRGLQKVEIMC